MESRRNSRPDDRPQNEPGLPLLVGLLIAATAWQAPHAVGAAFGQSLSVSAQLAAAAVLTAVMGVAAWAVWRRTAEGGEKTAPVSEIRNRGAGSAAVGLRELLPEADYQRLLANLDSSAATDPFLRAFDTSSSSPASSEDADLVSHVLRNAAMCVTILNREGIIVSANQKLADATGYSIAELIGRPVRSLAAEGHAEGMSVAIRKVGAGRIESYRAERRLLRKDGSAVWFRSCVTRLGESGSPNDCEGTHILVLSEDITAEVAAREGLAWQIDHDPLTGLPNRKKLVEALEAFTALAKRDGGQVALICLDLNGFKLINDTLGHAAGDMLLKQVADRLRAGVGESEFLARIGGDKFAAITRGPQGAASAEQCAGRLTAIFSRPFCVLSSELNISASLGICLYPSDGLDAGEMIQGADVAVSNARRSGPNRFSFYSPQLKDEACERLLLGSRLRVALENREFYVDFQPQYAMAGNRLVGFEALCRWRSPTLGEISPARFVPAAEENGMILEIGRFVLREACRCVASWQTGPAPIRVAVNVSAVQFTARDFVETVLSIVRENGIDPGLLELELTESTLVRDREESARKMEELRSFGIRIAIDDFGTGYSSLSYLQSMPVDALKVDRTFTARLGSAGAENTTAETMVRAIIAMARALGLHIVTEGVETEAQAEILRQLGTDDAQGYLYGRPETPEAAAARVRREALAARETIDLSALAGALGEPAPQTADTSARLPDSATDSALSRASPGPPASFTLD